MVNCLLSKTWTLYGMVSLVQFIWG